MFKRLRRVALLGGLALVCLPGPAAAAERYLSPGGGDFGTCATAIAPCRSFNYAYHQAQPGDVVVVGGGTYASQDLRDDPTKTSDADVVFRPALGAAVTTGQLDFGKAFDDVGASHVTVEGIEVQGWATFKRTVDVTLRNVRVHGAIHAAGARQLAFYGGEWGDPNVTNDNGHPEFACYCRPGINVRPDGLIVDGVFIHDIHRADDAGHSNCLHPQDGTNIVIRNNRFRSCDIFSMLVSPSGRTGPIENVTIENNVFEPSTNLRGNGKAVYSFMLAPESAPIRNVTVRYNTLGDGWTVNTNASTVNGRVVGNFGDASGCPSSMVHTRNVWIGRTRCSPTDKIVGSPGWTGEYDLQASSPAIDAGDPNDYPATDARGKRRFAGAGPDAGALEFGDPPATTTPTGPEAPWIDIRQRGRVRVSRRGRVRVIAQCVGPAGQVCRGRVSLLRARKDRRGRRAVYASGRVNLRVRPAPTKLTLKLTRRARRALRTRRRLAIVAVASTTGGRRDQAALSLRRRRG